MDTNALMLLGMVKMQDPHTKQTELVEVKGFDVLGFFFPFLRLLVSGQIGKSVLCFLACCTLIGYPISSWYIGFNFKKMNFEQKIKSGWTIVEEKKSAQPAA